MKYLNVAETAERWKLSERSVRNYCAQGRVEGAMLDGKTWYIAESAAKPGRKPKLKQVPLNLLARICDEKKAGVSGGIYHKIQIELTYNSNHMEGSSLTHEQTRYIYETNTIDGKALQVDDIVETANHFRCVDVIIDQAKQPLSEAFIKQLHMILKSGTLDSRQSWFATGDYKRVANEVGGKDTTAPEDVAFEMKKLLAWYRALETVGLDEILEFHYRFENIHPFQDGNGRIGRLLLFKECLRYDIVPFIIEDDMKLYYYRGLSEWRREKGFLRDTCLSAQDRFKTYLDYFGIEYRG